MRSIMGFALLALLILPLDAQADGRGKRGGAPSVDAGLNGGRFYTGNAQGDYVRNSSGEIEGVMYRGPRPATSVPQDQNRASGARFIQQP